MPTVTTVTVKSSGGDYTSLSAAEAGEQADLVAGDVQIDIECYASAAGDSTQVTVNGWTTDATRFIRIICPTGERHAGVWDAAKYHLSVSTSGSPGGCFTVREDFTRIEYLQVRNLAATPGDYDCAIYGDTGTYRVDGCIARDGKYTIYASIAGSEIRNTITYGGTRSGAYITASGGNQGAAYNCTLVGALYGLEMSASGVYPIATNVYAHGGTYGFFGQGVSGGFVTKTNCMSSDTTATIDNGGGSTNCTNSVAHSTANFTSVTGGSEDYHIVTGSALIDVGTDLSGTFTTDIDGVTRTGTWDIGADEFVGGGGGSFCYLTLLGVG